LTSTGFVPLTVSIDGAAQQGQTLTASANGSLSTYQWQEIVGGVWYDISGATNPDYVVQQSDVARQIRVEVTGNGTLTAISAATNAILDANGNQPVYEADNGSVIGDSQYQYIYGTATNTTINSGGEQNIYSNGTAIGAIINTGGQQVDWGTANNAVLDGGNQYVWGTADNTTVNSGTQYVETGGDAVGTTVETGGQQVVFTDGVVSGTTLSGGDQYIYGATTSNGTTIDSGSVQYLYSAATNTTVNSGGEQNVYANGAASGTTINTGGTEIVWGTDSNATIAGGTQYVVGTATGATINAGTQYIESGGTAGGTTIDGSTEHVFTGGTANGVTFGGLSGTLVLDQASTLSGSISGFQSGDTIDLSFVSFGSGTTLGYQANTSGPAGGTLTVTDGTNLVTLALLGQYSAASFALSSDGSGGTFITEPSTMSQNQLASPVHA